MVLCLDVGNSQIFGGIFQDGKVEFQFRRNTNSGSASDELGLFLVGVLRENGYDPTRVERIAICSVVPNLVYSLRNACIKYFERTPFFLQPGVKTGLKIKYRNPVEVGADRIANSIAASHLWPNSNLLIVDLGTATKFCAINKDKDYLGGVIVAGLKISMEALVSHTARLPSVEICEPETIVGRSTIENIQSGLFYGHLGIIREISTRIKKECFPAEDMRIIGTGGLSVLFEKQRIYDEVVPDLVLQGLYQALKMNT